MKLTKTKLAAAAAITALGLGAAMPASAALLLRVTDSGSGLSFTCMDNVGACDTNATVGAIGLSSSFANTALGAGRAFDVAGASATVLNTATQAQIDQSGNVTRLTGVGGTQSIFFDATFDGFNLFGRTSRTLSASGTGTFTDIGNASDGSTLRAFNDPDNQRFAGIAGDPNTNGNEFAAPLIVFQPPFGCAGTNPISCAGASSLGGISEGDPFSLTNRYAIQGTPGTGPNPLSVQFTASSLKTGILMTVPEPTSLLLVGAGILGLGLVGRRRKS